MGNLGPYCDGAPGNRLIQKTLAATVPIRNPTINPHLLTRFTAWSLKKMDYPKNTRRDKSGHDSDDQTLEELFHVQKSRALCPSGLWCAERVVCQ